MDTEWFKFRMKELGVSQDLLARELGRERTSIVRILSGNQPMRLDDALVFARMLRTTYQEIVEHALDIPTGGLDFSGRDGSVPLRYRIAAAESHVGNFEFGDDAPLLSAPPEWKPTSHAFAAEVADRSIDMRFGPGSILYCIPPNELGRPLRAGEPCVLLHLAKGKPFEVRAGIITPAPNRSGFIVVGASRDRKFALSLWFSPEKIGEQLDEFEPRDQWKTETIAEFDYDISANDAAIVVGIVTASIRP